MKQDNNQVQTGKQTAQALLDRNRDLFSRYEIYQDEAFGQILDAFMNHNREMLDENPEMKAFLESLIKISASCGWNACTEFYCNID